MKRKLIYLLIPLLLIVLGVAFRLSAARAQEPQSGVGACHQGCAEAMVICMQSIDPANEDAEQAREKCRLSNEKCHDSCRKAKLEKP